MNIDKAYSLYEKLKNYLVVVPSFGYYVPLKNGRHGDKDWPLLYREPYRFPLCVTWEPKLKEKEHKRPTFEEFCKVYGIDLEVE